MCIAVFDWLKITSISVLMVGYNILPELLSVVNVLAWCMLQVYFFHIRIILYDFDAIICKKSK